MNVSYFRHTWDFVEYAPLYGPSHCDLSSPVDQVMDSRTTWLTIGVFLQDVTSAFNALLDFPNF